MRAARKIIVTGAIAGGLFVGANVLAEQVVESRIAEEAKRSFGTATAPSVSVDGFPILLNVLKGRIPRASLDGRDAIAQDLKITHLRLMLEGIRASLGDLSAGKPIGIDRGLVEAEVTGASINEYVRSRGEKVTVSIRPGKAVVTGTVARIGKGTAEGVPKLVGRILSFTPDRVAVNGKQLTGPALAVARRELAFQVDMPILPGGVRITAIELRQDLVTFVARLTDATIDLSGA